MKKGTAKKKKEKVVWKTKEVVRLRRRVKKVMFIDPDPSTDSTVGYKVSNYGYVRSSDSIVVLMTDCNRKISWVFELEDKRSIKSAKKKIDNILLVLNEVRDLIYSAKSKQVRYKAKKNEVY